MRTRKRGSSRRLWSLLLALCMAFTLAVPAWAAEEGPVYFDGTYQGTGTGYQSDITVQVTVAGGKITKAEAISQGDTAAYWNRAAVLLDQIVEQQTADLDAVSGATYSSGGILAAAKAALEQAKSDPSSPFVSGEGTAESPYVIASAEKLAQFAQTVDEGETYEGKFIQLGADLDLSELGQWNPIGQEGMGANLFGGSFDGRGHTISGLTITGKYGDIANLGLFSTLAKTAAVKNLNLDKVRIKVRGADVLRVGAVAGDTKSGGVTVDSCSAAGSVDVTSTGAALVYGGGLLGRAMNGAVMTNSWTDVSVSAASQGGSNSAYAGGIAGMTGNNSLLVNNACFGELDASAPVSNNFGALAGGLSGMLTSKTYNNYAMGDVSIASGSTEHTWVGALAGQVTTSGMQKDAEGVYQYPETGPFRALNYYPADIALTSVKQGAATRLEPAAGGAGTPRDTLFTGTAMARAEMGTEAFADVLNDNLADVIKLLNAYGIEGLALRQWQDVNGSVLPVGDTWTPGNQASDTVFASGKGTKKTPYVILTADQLRNFAASVTGDNTYSKTYVRLGADIDLSDAEWTSIGGIGSGAAAFNGIFDGAGFAVRGMTIGTAAQPKEVDAKTNILGFFGQLGADAVVKNLNLTDVFINVSSNAGLRVGGIAGLTAGQSDGYRGTVIDSCSVTGTLQAKCTKGNAFQGALVGSLSQGAMINCVGDAEVICENTAAYPEAGGLAGMNNGGLIANSCSLGNVRALTGENNSGYTLASLLAGYAGGDVVNCYADGALTTNDNSRFSGVLAGWMRGAARTYSCWYNDDQALTMAGQAVTPKTVVGVPPTAYADEEGRYYVGGLTDGLESYNASTVNTLADKLNATLTAFPVDISLYGLKANALKSWQYDAASKTVKLADAAATTYVRPACEVIPQEEQVMQPGVWYGRDKAKTTVVALTVSENKVRGIEILSGESSGAAYDEAVAKAKEKALYGDTSGYGEADPALFAGGTGTEADPYQIASEEQLRYLAASVNEDVDWEGVYFKQTADIQLTGDDWFPIGWGVMGKIKSSVKLYSQYPFRGNFDGGDFTIRGLHIGSADAPSTDPRCALTAGLFGIIEGDEQTNDTPQNPETRYVNLKNIHLEDVSINVTGTYDNYTGALVGDPELGFRADNCTAEGAVHVKTSEGTIYMGGLMGYPLRGLISNCWTDLKVSAESEKGTVYAGGLYGMDNRTTTVNAFALGDVKGGSEKGTIYAGGLSGSFAGIRCNCYAAGKVSSAQKTDYIGSLNGQLAGIGGESCVYYNSDTKLDVAGEAVDARANGYSAGAKNQTLEEGKTGAELKSDAFVDLLNGNTAKAMEELTAMHEVVKDINHHGHAMYYTGSALSQWARSESGILAFSGAKAVPGAQMNNAINALPEIDALTLEDRDAVARVRAAYDALNDEQKKLVSAAALEKLEAVEAQLAVLEKAAEQTEQVVQAIEKLPALSKLTVGDANEIAAARAAYDALSEEQRAQVSAADVEKLEAAEAKIDLLNAQQKLKDAEGKKTKDAKTIKKLQAQVEKMTVQSKTVTKVKVKAQKSGKAAVSWKSLGKGYQYVVYQSTKQNKGFKKAAAAKKAKATVKKLKKGKTYYYKVRGWKKVSGKKVWTKYSAVVKVKAK